MIDNRKQNLLKHLIIHYYKTCQPIASGFLCSSCGLSLSPATIRNEMAELEKEGYIFQPHTSAGRIPTEKGFQFYVDNFLTNRKINIDFFQSKEFSLKNEHDLKDLAKKIAETTNETVILAFAKNDIFYTGISNLFSKPEFKNYELIYNVSKVLERLEEVVKIFEDGLDDSIKIYIGKNNPIDASCSTVATKLGNVFFAVSGPMRMDYDYVYGTILGLKDILAK